ncbi:integrating conjugative element protein [Pseudomonas reactans]|jgi:integrating conjugative element protein (TIGR03765 family)|uniref:Integrating conjugative element protein n=3 Tax=Pseudomonas TaxID=286 RepID=A0A7Y7ZGK7_9PSED|nr:MULTISPECIES: integrating conjugative element protein [Pseudomonas]ASV34878.1 integrating conjugative element protein [Pseudomonas sp. NS1(2017)]KGE65857.1 conjugal transfer protein [Pseudomonas fluorescens LMG 5329]NWA45706.1 integrating conjugative element protein [Pseudomonas reactans]NWB30157.1 integrating conjugative element protein [Pseudomonas gingeri]NWC36631.1 integrating conjugative element protein [Pseudomonas gingeri]
MKRISVVCYCTLLLVPFAQPELSVAGDRPSDFNRPHFQVARPPINNKIRPDRAMHADLSTFTDEAWILPIRSSYLSPGQITSRALNMPGLRPFFLVGDDPQSLTWLRQRAAELQELGAAGLAVEVADTEALARIRAAAPDITILPVNGNDIATRLQIEHYPVLITATLLEQ